MTQAPVVLFIDDNAQDAELLQHAFQALSEECLLICVENAVQAYNYLLGRGSFRSLPRPDMILLDLNMPVIDGFDFLRELRADPLWRQLPVIVFTSSSRDKDRIASLDLGARKFVTKPRDWNGYLDAAKRLQAELGLGAGNN